MTSMLEHALTYARMGLRIFPVYEAVDETVSPSRCSCASPEPHDNAGKHPRTANGLNDATSDEEQITHWWTVWPDASIGLACGEGSGVVVIDVDAGEGKVGEEKLEEFERLVCPLPPTRTSRTGGGGRHLFYRYPAGSQVGSRNGWLENVDIKSNGGYVLLPPSAHKSGRPYAWLDERARMDLPVEVVRELPLKDAPRGRSSSRGDLPPTSEILRGVAEGKRDDYLFRLACRLMKQLDDEAAVWVLLQEAASNCTPPFPLEQLKVKLNQALKYPYDEETERLLAEAEASLDGATGDDSSSDGESDPDEEDDGQGPVNAPGERHETDDGNALRLVDRYGDEVRYAEGLGWLVWDGERWQRDDCRRIIECARDTVKSVYAEAIPLEDKRRRKARAAWAFKSEAQARIEAMASLARSDEKIVRRVEDFDQDPLVLNTKSGVLDLLTGSVHVASRSESHTKVTAVGFDPLAGCPRWLAFLEKVIPDPDTRAFIKRAVGYSLTGVIRQKVFFILLGGGDNGKTVFIETLRHVLGDYALASPASMIVGRRDNAIPNDVARLRGSRFVLLSETEPGARLNSDLLKRLTGGDIITARFMRQEFFDFKSQCKLWLATNHAPVISDFSDGMWERLRLIPFGVHIPKEEQIPLDQMLAGLAEEGPGILRWAMEGCLEWEQHGLVEPADVMVATDAYREDQDWFGQFLEECCVLEPRGEASSNELFAVFQRWCALSGIVRPWTQQAFGRELKARHFAQGRDARGRRMWRGVRPRELSDAAEGGV